MAATPTPNPIPQGKKVLLIEAHDGLRDMYKHFLRTAGFDAKAVPMVPSAPDALRAYGKLTAVVIDVSASSDPEREIAGVKSRAKGALVMALIDTYRDVPQGADYHVANDFPLGEVGIILRKLLARQAPPPATPL